MYALLVVEGGLPPLYVLDQMQLYEVPFLVQAIEEKRHPGWEQARMTSMIVANALGAKVKSKDLVFPWEKDVSEDKPDVAEMRRKLNKLKNKE